MGIAYKRREGKPRKEVKQMVRWLLPGNLKVVRRLHGPLSNCLLIKRRSFNTVSMKMEIVLVKTVPCASIDSRDELFRNITIAQALAYINSIRIY